MSGNALSFKPYQVSNVFHRPLPQEYLNLLRESPTVFRNVLLRIRDYPDEVYIIRYSMGKDSTGVDFALLVWLARVSAEIASAKYSLSEDALQCLIPGIFRLVQETAPCGTSGDECQRIAQEAIKARWKKPILQNYSGALTCA